MITWHTLLFNQLTTTELYQLLQLRVNIFVVEQNCPYEELDGKDHHTGVYHLIGKNRDNEIVATARLLPNGVSGSSVHIGRIAIDCSARGNGLGHRLVDQALAECQRLWPNQIIDISAQAHLQNFYQQHGFKSISSPYLEDGIPHIEMRKG